MQNRYVGDIGDFGKYGLLKSLCSSGKSDDGRPLKLGVVWYLVPDEVHNGDGGLTYYLKPSAANHEQFRTCDQVLYDNLREIVTSNHRHVATIRTKGVLPVDTRFYEAPLTFEGIQGNGTRRRDQRAQLRDHWIKGALQATEDCEVVFLDPDNGLEVKVGRCQARGPKYAYFDEMLPFTERKQTLMVYHHIARQGSAREQIASRIAQIKEKLNRNSFALWYHRGTARAFFVIPADQHADLLRSNEAIFLSALWLRHFELIAPT